MWDYFLNSLPSLTVIAIYWVISTIIDTSFKKIYNMFLLIMIAVGVIGIVIFSILNNNVIIGFSILIGFALSDLVKRKKDKKNKINKQN